MPITRELGSKLAATRGIQRTTPQTDIDRIFSHLIATVVVVESVFRSLIYVYGERRVVCFEVIRIKPYMPDRQTRRKQTPTSGVWTACSGSSKVSRLQADDLQQQRLCLSELVFELVCSEAVEGSNVFELVPQLV